MIMLYPDVTVDGSCWVLYRFKRYVSNDQPIIDSGLRLFDVMAMVDLTVILCFGKPFKHKLVFNLILLLNEDCPDIPCYHIVIICIIITAIFISCSNLQVILQ